MAEREPRPGPVLRPLSAEEWTALEQLHPAFRRAAQAHVDEVATGPHLEPKVKAFVALVIDAAVTHLDESGIETHIDAARSAGATDEEIVEVLECASTLSVHAMNFGLPVLLDVLAERGTNRHPVDGGIVDERRRRLKEDFTRRRGYWNSTWDELLALAPDYFATYTELSSVPWDTGTLSPAVRELLYIAFDTSATHLYRVGLRLHIENALDYGATPEQVVEVMQIASLIGLRAVGRGAVSMLR